MPRTLTRSLFRPRGLAARLLFFLVLLSAAAPPDSGPFAFFALTARAGTTLYEHKYDTATKTDTRITLTGMFESMPPSGYAPVRVSIRNGTAQDRAWRVRFIMSVDGYSTGSLTTTSSFELPADAGTEAEHDILIPMALPNHSTGGYRNLKVEVSSPGLGSQSQDLFHDVEIEWPPIGISKTLGERNLGKLNSKVQSARSSSVEDFAAQFDPALFPADWRGLSGLDALMITDDEWAALEPAGRRALKEWVRLGGHLHLYTRSAELDVSDFGFDAASPGAMSASHSLGQVRLHSIKSAEFELNPDSTYRDFHPLKMRFETYLEDFDRDWKLPDSMRQKEFSPGLVILLLVTFGVVVGPVNLFMLAKPGQRHRLFITTPIISLVASLLIVVIILFADGLGGSGRRVMIVNLEPGEEERTAYVIQEQVARTGVLLGSSFNVKGAALMTPVVLQASSLSRFGNSADFDGSFVFRDDRREGDWFLSRSEQGQQLVSTQPTRSRVERLPSEGDPTAAPRLFSSVEFPLEEFYYKDSERNTWRATGPIQSGGEPKLIAATQDEFVNWWNDQTADVSPNMRKQLRDLTSRKDYFFAVIRRPGAFATETLESIRWKEDKTLIHGPVPAGAATANAGSASPPVER